MTERGEIYETLDLALRVGEFFLSAGAGAADVTATMLATAPACGVQRGRRRHVRRPVAASPAKSHEPAAILVAG